MNQALTHQPLALRFVFVVVVVVVVVRAAVFLAPGCRWLAGCCLGEAFGLARRGRLVSCDSAGVVNGDTDIGESGSFLFGK